MIIENLLQNFYYATKILDDFKEIVVV